ncbi:MAG: hypothetical protein ABW221_10370 [Vicinamibacteria bacterium]
MSEREMEIKDVLVFPQGIALAGAEPDAGLAQVADDSLRALVGARITITRPDGAQVAATVLEVRITRSVADRRNVYIGVPADTGLGIGDVGGTVGLATT